MTGYDRYFDQGGLTDQVDADQLVDQIGLTAAEIEWRKRFLDFDDEDADRLAEFDEEFLSRADTIGDGFYDHLMGFEETAAVIDRSPKDIEQLKRTQKAYLVTLADGEYGEEYFRNRARIGKLHDLLDMPMKHYIGQYNVYYRLLLSIVGERLYDRLEETVEHADETVLEDGDRDAFTRRLYADVEDSFDELHSLLKILNLDMQVAADTYLQSHLDDLTVERDRFAALFENVPTPVVVVRFDDGEGQVEQVNPAFEELFGYTAADLADKPFEQFLRPPGEEPRPIDDRAAVENVESSTDSELSEAEVTLETKFGHREFIRVSAPVDRPGLDDLEYAFYLDVTDQKHRQERLQVLSRILRHDIRNQMNVVAGSAETLQGAVDDDPTVDRIETAAEDLLSMSRKIREIERVVTNKADRKPIDAGMMVEEVLEDLREEYPATSVSMSIHDARWIQATDSIRVALENVIENAAEHNDSEDPTVEITVVESLDGEHVDIRVADNGPGIPPREYEVLTGERERSQIDHTSGLGLWTVNWIVTKLGGSLQFDANSPDGSIVTLRLPKAEPQEQ